MRVNATKNAACRVAAVAFTLALGLCALLLFRPGDAPSAPIDARSAILLDASTGEALYESNADEKLAPASMTKVMTALCVMRAVDSAEIALDQTVTVTSHAWDGLDETSSNVGLREGEKLTVSDLLRCMLLSSACEAAYTLAEAVGGDIPSFVGRMNECAAELGCSDTHFTSPHGMPNPDHYTTARDLSVMGRELMRYDELASIVGATSAKVGPTNRAGIRYLTNLNALLPGQGKYSYERCSGIKTGTWGDDGHCLLSAAYAQNGDLLVCAVLGCDNPQDQSGTVLRKEYVQSKVLLEWGVARCDEALSEPVRWCVLLGIFACCGWFLSRRAPGDDSGQ